MIRNVITVMRGTLLAQAVGLMILPVLTRSFTPIAFGHFQIFQAFIGISLVSATTRYEIAIMRATDQRELGAILAICALVNLSLSCLFLVAYWIYCFTVSGGFASHFGFPFFLILLGFIFGGFAQYWSYILVRQKLFEASSNSKVVQAVTNAGSAFSLAVTYPISSGLVVADVAGRVAASFAMYALSFKAVRSNVIFPSWEDIRRAASKYREYPLVTFPGGLIDMAGSMLTPIMIYQTFDAATSGQFGLLERSASLPLALVSVSVSQVYMGYIMADLREQNNNAGARYLRLLATLGAVSVPVAIVITFYAPALFALAFGPGWEEAATFARVMMPAYCLALLSGCVNMTLIMLGWQKTQVFWQVSRLAVMTALWFGGSRLHWGVRTMVVGHSAVTSVFAATMILLAYRAVRMAEAKDKSMPNRHK